MTHLWSYLILKKQVLYGIIRKQITVFPAKDNSIIAYPSVDLTSVIAIYSPMHNTEFPAPGNAVIYNADGTLRTRLMAPELISDVAKKSAKLAVDNNYSFDIWFELVSWTDKLPEVTLTFWIGFGQDFFEERTFNPDNGEFGVCLGTGRI